MKPLSRRNFLKAGSISLTIPFLESFPGLAQAASASGSLKRILFFGLSNAQYENMLMPTSTTYMTGPQGVRYIPLNSITGDVSRIFTAAKYNGLKSKMNIMRGFDLVVGNETVGAGHDILIPLTACDGKGTAANVQMKDSIDTVIANSPLFYPNTPFRKVLNAVPVSEQGFRYNYSLQGGSQRAQLEGPSKIFADFFSGTLPGDVGTPTTPIDTNLSRRLALNSAVSKLSALTNSSRLSAADKMKLSQHTDMVNNLIATLAPPTGGTTPGAGQGCAKPTLASGINESFNSASGNQARLKACLDQIFMSFLCQLTNMAVFHPVVAYDTGNFEMGDGGNDVYHQMAGHNYEPDKYLRYNGWVYDQLLYLLNLMEGTRESNGLTMLDNSLVVVLSNDACGVHSYQDFPVVTFGSLGGLIKTGNYINYQRTNMPTLVGGHLSTVPSPNAAGEYYYKYNYQLGRPLGSFHTTLLNVLKIPHSGFGDYSDPNGNYSQFTTAAAKQESLPILV